MGCGTGSCGACTVMISRVERGQIKHRSVNACIYPVCLLDGAHVTTIEGIGSLRNMHPVQETLARMHGSQCGFCTPGMVVSIYTALRNGVTTAAELEGAITGNLCR